MNIQNTTQPSFGKLYMPEYKTLVKKYGERIANTLESQREPAEKAASNYDVYVTHAFTRNDKNLVFLEAAPLKTDDTPRKTSLISCHYPMSADNLSKSIKKFIKEKKYLLLRDILVEKNLATEAEAHSFFMNYMAGAAKLVRDILEAHEFGNEQEKVQLLEKAELINKTFAKNGLNKKSDKKSIIPLDINDVIGRMIKKNVPLKQVMEDLQNIGMYIPISNLNR